MTEPVIFEDESFLGKKAIPVMHSSTNVSVNNARRQDRSKLSNTSLSKLSESGAVNIHEIGAGVTYCEGGVGRAPIPISPYSQQYIP